MAIAGINGSPGVRNASAYLNRYVTKDKKVWEEKRRKVTKKNQRDKERESVKRQIQKRHN